MEESLKNITVAEHQRIVNEMEGQLESGYQEAYEMLMSERKVATIASEKTEIYKAIAKLSEAMVLPACANYRGAIQQVINSLNQEVFVKEQLGGMVSNTREAKLSKIATGESNEAWISPITGIAHFKKTD